MMTTPLEDLIRAVLENDPVVRSPTAPTNVKDGIKGRGGTSIFVRRKKKKKSDEDKNLIADDDEYVEEELEQKIPVSNKNQDNGLISFAFAQISKIMSHLEESSKDRKEFVQKIEDGFVEFVDLTKVKASQTWLSKQGGGDTLLKSARFMFELEKRPIIVIWNGEKIILDGHHRMNRALEAGFNRKLCYVFNIGDPRILVEGNRR